jgi:prevent-host-death family protein
MREVGIRELKQRTSDILRRVRQGRESVDITYRGRVVARLVPVEEAPRKRGEAAAVWVQMDELAAEIGARWPAGLTAARAIAQQRR